MSEDSTNVSEDVEATNSPADRVHRVVDWFFGHWPELLLGLAGLAAVFMQVFPTHIENDDGELVEVVWGFMTPSWWCFWVYVVAGIVGGLFSIRHRSQRGAATRELSVRVGALKDAIAEKDARIHRLEREAVEQQQVFRATIDSLLDGLLREVGLFGPHSRVSTYVHNGAGFVMFARRSFNTAYARAGRALYPLGMGVIGKAWREGEARDLALPANRGDWNQHMQDHWGMPTSVASELSMHCRSIYGLRLDDHSRKPFAVLVVESDLTGRATGAVNGPTEARIKDSETWKTIHELLVQSQELLPDVASAREEGF